MKNKKKELSLFLVCVLLASSMSFTSVQAQTDSMANDIINDNKNVDDTDNGSFYSTDIDQEVLDYDELDEEDDNFVNVSNYITDIAIYHSGNLIPSSYFTFDEKSEQQTATFIADKLTDNLSFSIGVNSSENLYCRILRDGQAIYGYENDIRIDTDRLEINPFTERTDNNYCFTGNFEVIVGEKSDTNNDGIIDTSDGFGQYSSYTINYEILPRITDVKVTDTNGAQIIYWQPVGESIYEDSYYFSVNSDTIIFDTVKTKPNIGSSAVATKLYVGDNDGVTANVIPTRPISIDLSDYDQDGDGVAAIPIRMAIEAQEISRTITLYVTCSDPNLPVISDLQGFECDKGENRSLSVDVECENIGTLSYQWFSRSTQNASDKAVSVSGANAKEFLVPTNRAGTVFYSCEVTNTIIVDGVEKQFINRSNEVAVTVYLSEVSNPIIIEQLGTYELQNQGSEYVEGYSAEYTSGQILSPLFVRVEKPEVGTVYSVQFWIRENAAESATEMNGNSILVESTNASFRKYQADSSYDDYAFISIEAFPVGEYDVYCVITAIDKNDESRTASTTSDSVHIVVKNAESVVAGTGTQTDPYQITCAEDLEWVREQVANGNPFVGSYFVFKNDVTLPDGWSPIGCTKNGSTNIDSGNNLNAFSGNIDGAGYTLTVPEGGLPLLGYVKGATVSNLNIYGTQINGYGLVNNFEGVGLQGSAIVIDNCTLKSGTQTLKSGFIGANITSNHYAGTSAGFTATIRNCTVESGVVIGYTGEYDRIGSIAGRFQGTIENCVSYATVKGTTCVGGLVGARDQAMGICTISDSAFHGTVTASGDYAGGIVGSGYDDFGEASAPNAGRPAIQGCSCDGTVIGANCVGGILGGDQYVAQTWNNVISYVTGNTFTGTVSGNQYVGAIIGYYNSLNRYDNISGNLYSDDCGTDQGIGFVKYVDTNAENSTIPEGTIVFSTEGTTENCPTVKWCAWRADHNRTDDPLGRDAAALCQVIGEASDPVCYELNVSGTYKNEYTVGEELDLRGIVLNAVWTDGTTSQVELSDVTVEGYVKDQIGSQTLTLSYGDAKAYITVTVKPEAGEIHVSMRLIGATESESGEYDVGEGVVDSEYQNWIKTKEVTMEAGATVGDLFELVVGEAGLEYEGLESGYISSITAPEDLGGYPLAAFTNGQYSGWMYTVNGSHPDVGLNDYYLEDGDAVIWHYINDYRYESSDWDDISNLGDENTWDPWLKVEDTEPGEEPEEAEFAIISQPSDVNAVAGDAVSYSVKATAADSYQWYYSKDGQKWYKSAADGSSTDTICLTVSKANLNNIYKCKVTGKDRSILWSETARNNVADTALRITAQPASHDLADGKTAVYTVQAVNAESYQWYYSKDNGASWYKTSIQPVENGEKTESSITVNVAASNVNNIYRCKVTGTDGTTLKTETVGLTGIPVITEQPADQTAKAGDTVSYSVKADNAESYQWYYSKDGQKWYKSSAGSAATDTLTLKASASNMANQYKCKITGKEGIVLWSDIAQINAEEAAEAA